LQTDKVNLNDKIKKSYYRDEHLNHNVAQIQAILEQSMGLILQTAEVDSRTTIWKDLEMRMRESLKKYQEHLQTCRGRREFLECQECMERLNAVLKSARQVPDEDSKLTCCICLDAQVNCSAKCGHLLCATCAQSVPQCPICRQAIQPEHIRPVYFC
jgi:hypothetical protein